MTAARPAKQIQISLPAARLDLGDPLPLTVVYANRGAAPLSFREPARTWEVMLSVTEPTGETKTVSFGRIFHTEAEGIARTTIEPADQIDLAPGAEHRFAEDLWVRWPELWLPGRATLLVLDRSDDAETLRSNPLTLELHLSKTSIPRLLALARDPASSESVRTVAVGWLVRLHPLGPFAAAPTADQLPANATALDAWAAWWAASHDLPEVVAALAALDPGAPSP